MKLMTKVRWILPLLLLGCGELAVEEAETALCDSIKPRRPFVTVLMSLERCSKPTLN
ncbi:MAG: hypothetical protein ACFBSG_17865 [Leptolyngbyaceae cyanobacterium]